MAREHGAEPIDSRSWFAGQVSVHAAVLEEKGVDNIDYLKDDGSLVRDEVLSLAEVFESEDFILGIFGELFGDEVVLGIGFQEVVEHFCFEKITQVVFCVEFFRHDLITEEESFPDFRILRVDFAELEYLLIKIIEKVGVRVVEPVDELVFQTDLCELIRDVTFLVYFYDSDLIWFSLSIVQYLYHWFFLLGLLHSLEVLFDFWLIEELCDHVQILEIFSFGFLLKFYDEFIVRRIILGTSRFFHLFKFLLKFQIQQVRMEKILKLVLIDMELTKRYLYVGDSYDYQDIIRILF